MPSSDSAYSQRLSVVSNWNPETMNASDSDFRAPVAAGFALGVFAMKVW